MTVQGAIKLPSCRAPSASISRVFALWAHTHTQYVWVRLKLVTVLNTYFGVGAAMIILDNMSIKRFR
jgi:hypothetical protein